MRLQPPKVTVNPDYVKCGFCKEAILKFGYKYLSIGCFICKDCIENVSYPDVEKAVYNYSQLLIPKKSIYPIIKEILS